MVTGEAIEIERRIGGYSSGRPGPVLITVAGLHGNEPAGLQALRRVLSELEALGPPIRGRLAALVGNLGALARGRRFLDEDLNRIWKQAPNGAESRERKEREDLAAAAGREIGEDWDRTILLDFHSTSASGSPFCIMADTLKNRRLAAALPLPVVLGLEENISGTLIEHFCERGPVALVIEGGRHDLASTVDNHESAVWIAMVAAGMLDEGDVPGLDDHRARLRRAVGGTPRFLEVVHRHTIPEGRRFAMEPGFLNLSRVERGRLLAREGPDLERPVTSPDSALLLMPLYQDQGEDGFFLARPLPSIGLAVSSWLRRRNLERILPWLPGVVAHPEHPRTLTVDRRLARGAALDLLHLFGYRHVRPNGRRLEISRRAEGFRYG